MKIQKKHLLGLFSLVVCCIGFFAYQDFVTEQKRYKKVRTAYTEKENYLSKKLKEKKLSLQNLNILIVAYKDEQELEVYVKSKTAKQYQKFLTYDICQNSGDLGHKNKEGDYQVPEGFYYINHFNPMSSYFLSLGISYPNLADKRRNPKTATKDLGGAIYLHGACVTIGCIPITDEYIKEVYVLAVQARTNGQTKIPIYVLPFRMNKENQQEFYPKYKNLVGFWDNIKIGYEKFEKNKEELSFSIDAKGNYVFK
ncbi:L,D-transpeptidase family protein [Bernardetia sp.]|uniref:L,D-transpeptidase family protein n=1 Tax=Bernardetia sp. TaxID=1937974 RepID=UPI0025C46105|nr:L,D-transpeptidase family protein [Bernardetia sp.]